MAEEAELEDKVPSWALWPGIVADSIAAVCSGNFDSSDSTFKLSVQLVQRAGLIVSPIFITMITLLSGDIAGPDAPGCLQFAIWTQFPWIIMSVNSRFRDPECMSLLRATSQRSLPVSRRTSVVGNFLRGFVKFLIVVSLALLVVMRAVMFALLPKVGFVLGSVSFFIFMFAIMGICDVLCKASYWVHASKCAIEGFGDHIAALLTAGSARHLPTRQVSVLNVSRKQAEVHIVPLDVEASGAGILKRSCSGVSTYSMSCMPPELNIESFESAYDEAAAVVTTMNAIFSGPLTVLLFTICGIDVLMFMFNSQDSQAARSGIYLMFTVPITLMMVVLLQWLASVGDTSVAVSRLLLSPHCYLRLSVAFERECPGLGEQLKNSLQSSVLGFEVYNVIMTTQKIIYLFGSVMLGLVITLSPIFYNAGIGA